jgi:hypothetical protein
MASVVQKILKQRMLTAAKPVRRKPSFMLLQINDYDDLSLEGIQKIEHHYRESTQAGLIYPVQENGGEDEPLDIEYPDYYVQGGQNIFYVTAAGPNNQAGAIIALAGQRNVYTKFPLIEADNIESAAKLAWEYLERRKKLAPATGAQPAENYYCIISIPAELDTRGILSHWTKIGQALKIPLKTVAREGEHKTEHFYYLLSKDKLHLLRLALLPDSPLFQRRIRLPSFRIRDGSLNDNIETAALKAELQIEGYIGATNIAGDELHRPPPHLVRRTAWAHNRR